MGKNKDDRAKRVKRGRSSTKKIRKNYEKPLFKTPKPDTPKTKVPKKKGINVNILKRQDRCDAELEKHLLYKVTNKKDIKKKPNQPKVPSAPKSDKPNQKKNKAVAKKSK